MIWDFIRDKILHAVRENDSVFSLIADKVTCTDISNKEILSLCVRYVSLSPKIQIKEVFIDFVQVYGITDELIAKTILHTLRNHRIDVTKCRGQCYDGAFGNVH